MGRYIAIVALVVAAAAAAVVLGTRTVTANRGIPTTAWTPSVISPQTQQAFRTGFSQIVDKDLPSVVNISSSRVTGGNRPNRLFPELDPFFRKFFGELQPERVERSLGSGVVVRGDGYVLTNNHVITGASDISVTLGDKRNYKGRLVGADPLTDLAVIKVDANNLPVVPFADSSHVRVGDIVLAMGNPFGLSQTVTMGIISAKGRAGLGIEAYEDFLQTDAAINPGNSGGPLVDTQGAIVGINTAILSARGGNEGIGFAIPSSMAERSLTQIVQTGKVVRGYLGIIPQDITPAMARALHLNQPKGVIVGDVEDGAPAAQAGLQRGDIILSVNGQPVDDANQLKLRISSMAPGTVAHLEIQRDGNARRLDVTLGEMPANPQPLGTGMAPSGGGAALDGVTVGELTPDIRDQLNLRSNVQGVVVMSIRQNSAAADAGLQPGDVIQEVNRKPVTSVNDFNNAARNSGRPILLLVNRMGTTLYLAIE